MSADESGLDRPPVASRSTKTASKAATSNQEYTLSGVLKPGRTTQYTTKALYDQMVEGDIDLNPDYQRDVVWSEPKQIGLVDSILRNFYIPPIIFAALFTRNSGSHITCLDGKQRLTSIESETGEKLFYKTNKPTTKAKKLLPDRYMTLFQNKQIVCIEYNDLTDDQEREVFQAIQLGMALTVAERLQAISGPWPSLVREIAEEFFEGSNGIGEFLDLDRTRARDFHNLAMTIFSISQLPLLVQGTQAQMEKLLARTDGPSEGTQKRIYETFHIFRHLAKDKQLRAPLRKPLRVAPAEFIVIGTLIAMYKDKLSLPQLSQAIKILRTQTRSEHVDVRTNSKVYKTMFHVLQKQIKTANLAATPGIPMAEEVVESLMLSAPKTKASSFGKRKRVNSSEDSDSDDGEGREETSKSKPIAKYQVPSKKILKTSGYSAETPKPLVMSPAPLSTSIKVEDLKNVGF
ncbi:hypothetical protein BU17DRAFT_55838 [Hysterangium stoloniferum]|nr:hypothetical protein BU17DRAFT_55838 [Hysterangium stoloniferum]